MKMFLVVLLFFWVAGFCLSVFLCRRALFSFSLNSFMSSLLSFFLLWPFYLPRRILFGDKEYLELTGYRQHECIVLINSEAKTEDGLDISRIISKPDIVGLAERSIHRYDGTCPCNPTEKGDFTYHRRLIKEIAK